MKGYDSHKLPLDVMWSDIDYMHMYKDLTIDDGPDGRYVGLPQYVDELNTDNRHYVPMMDAGISWSDEEPYKSGEKLDIFLKDP